MSAEPESLAAPPARTVSDDDLPDRALFWQWVWKSVRPVPRMSSVSPVNTRSRIKKL